jgi:hypothetical protein
MARVDLSDVSAELKGAERNSTLDAHTQDASSSDTHAHMAGYMVSSIALTISECTSRMF